MIRAFAAALTLAACQGDETVSGFVAEDALFTLTSINGVPFNASATIDLSETGRVAGSAPCNSYFANQNAPYPWWELEALASTKRACPDLQKEAAFFAALSRMTLSEVSGNTLILSNTDDEEMVFQAAP